MVEKIKKMVESKKKGFVSGIIVGMLVFSTLMLAYTTIVSGASPSIVYASPDNGDTFVDVWRGKGVNVTVNVSDGDGDLNQVVLKWNNSGTWDTFYDSGALGGEPYHNITVLNNNFTGSWEEYEYQICAYDTAWTNTTYSFTTGYVWGDHVMAYLDDLKGYEYATMFKNQTGEYYLAIHDNINNDVIVLTSTNGYDWITRPYTVIDDTAQDDRDMGVWSWFNYNSYPAFFYCDDGNLGYWKIAYYNGVSWNTASTGIIGRGHNNGGSSYERQGIGIDIKYYNGQYYILCGRGMEDDNHWYLSFYSGSLPNSWTKITDIETFSNAYASGYTNFQPNLNILDGYLVLTYIHDADGSDVGINGPLQWRIYDGVTLIDKGTVGSTITGLSVEKDPVNNQLVAVYTDGNNLYYRILDDPSGSWSDGHLIFTASGGSTIKNPQVHYIDHRLVVTFSYNLRGNYNIYAVFSPDYMSEAHGVLQQYNRIQFPDATPNQQHVNSSVFYFKNIDSRAITEINITFADMGSIQCESNFKLWGSTDNSSWTDLGTTDASGVLGPINSVTWATGMNWESGEIRYFKLEILDVGDVPEDLHSCDESIIWEITLE